METTDHTITDPNTHERRFNDANQSCAMNISTEVLKSYPLEDLLPAFLNGKLGAFFKGITFTTTAPVPDENGVAHRLALLGYDDEGDIQVNVMPQGFTKDELLRFRNSLDELVEGVKVKISGNTHTLALFSSCVIIEDHEIHDVRLTFQLDPFA